MFNITTIGDSMVDTFVVIDHEEAKLQCDIKREHCLLCLNYADKIPVKKTDQALGGNACNVAVGTQKLGLKTALLTELGDDLNGLVIKEGLEKTNVNTEYVKMLPNQETRYSIVLNYLGERTTLSYYTKKTYQNATIPQSQWLYYTSLGQNFTRVQEKIIKYLAKYPNTKLAVNPGSLQLKNSLNNFKKILKFTDLLFVNKEEAEKITGNNGKITELIKRLHKLGVKNIVLTDSTNGSYASNGQELYKMALYPTTLVEKTGAGDAYASGFLASWHYNEDLYQAMCWGTANAAGVISKIGAQAGLLNKNQITKLINKNSNIKPKLI
ncbi:MAG: hypothetical protein US42_C0008G0074 [Candidatus Magasanikbacteria bacterium GW2011_GWC2_37_14]|uniref:Carbohydrate kinase PfkB domain-containing protein n=1 Tax=Candidatus Magasanikbacteria bacterium GW2011_GWC2_37_14 TaxID=1619046 RepID=A0A0G0G8Y6_9BACT|nr:MAG: hypothetical protein US42_C0008G0074 [Candidatus Magasanikbacteria bacterium GW2011_GWC2_37_14]